MNRRWGLVLLPVAVGVVIGWLVENVATLPNPVYYARADAGALAWMAGLALTIVVAAGMGLWEVAERRCEQREADARAEAAADRRRFLQRLDHELKNPLTAIRAGLANAGNGAASPAQREALASVEAQVVRISRLAADLRKLAELETRSLEEVSVDIAELLQEAVALAEEQPAAGERALSLTLPQAPWPLPAVLGDRDLLFLSVFNLLHNALKFTRRGDTIEVRAFEDRRSVVIEVADTGPGIPDDELARVGEELYRGRAARGVPGSGLGFALARAIVERHGGAVAIRSRAGQGTVVTVRLPVQ